MAVGDDHAMLEAAQKVLEARFKVVRRYKTSEQVHVAPIGLAQFKGLAHEPPEAISYTETVLSFAPVTGKGATVTAAIFDWLINVGERVGGLSTGLFWRQEPQLDCDKNFETDTLTFKVYSRFAAH